MQGEESQHSDAPCTVTDCEVGDKGEEGTDGQTSPGEEAETNMHTDQCRHPRNWEAITEESEGLAYDDPRSDSDVTVTGEDDLRGPQLSSHDEPADSPPNIPQGLAPHSPGSPIEHMPPLIPTVTSVDTVEVHVTEVEFNNL